MRERTPVRVKDLAASPGVVTEPGSQGRSEQPDQLPALSIEAFGTTPSALTADRQLQDSRPRINSTSYLLLCSPLRAFPIGISSPSPMHHTQSVSSWEASPRSFTLRSPSLDSTDECAHHVYTDSVSRHNQRGPAPLGASSLGHCGLFH